MNIERDKPFRRRNAKIKEKGKTSKKEYKPEKNWKMMYIRSAKLARAKQLGVEYPKRNIRQILDDEQPLS